ncbi:lipoprotein, partial [Streptococcus suis]
MKLKRYLSLFVLGIALVVLAACGQKTSEDIVKT